MAIPISNVTRRVVYAASGTGPYNFTFEILANTDIAVYRDDTLLTLTTNYTVTINSNGTGYVTLTATPTGATQIAIVGNRTIQRTTDFVTGGDFFANTVNDEMDQQTIFAQQNAEGLARALQAPQTDPTSINMTLPRKADRANKYLAFDADGNPAPGDTAVEVAAIADIADEIAAVAAIDTEVTTVAGISSNVTTVAGNSSNITTVAGVSTNVTTVATNIAAVNTNATNIVAIQGASGNATAAQAAQTAAEAARDATLAAYDSFDDRYLGSKSSNPSVDNDGNALLAGALYYNTTVPEMRLYTGSAWVAAYVSGASYLLTANNLSELTASASTVRTNLGLVIGTNVQAWDADLDTWAGKTAPSGTVVGTSDSQTLSSKTLTNPTVNNYTEGVVAIGNSGTSKTIDLTNGTVQTVTMTGNCTFTMPTATAGKSFILVISTGAGSFTGTFTSVKWPNNVAPTITTTASRWDILTFVADGTNWYGNSAQAYA
jgi:hypothetical protein